MCTHIVTCKVHCLSASQVFFGATFEGAENTCNVVGGHLASIHNFEENRFVAELAKIDKQTTSPNDFTWIGLQDVANSKNWTWTDGTKVDFEFWGPDSPKRGLGNCVHLISDVSDDPKWFHKWGDYSCDQKMRTVRVGLLIEFLSLETLVVNDPRICC
ncbi:unnamed protein product [Cylicocyclus nassatus]|uniref:C-type lectin domain-containing protein n=1 Tax=Cylicocyclus nassatus TaxID=53992 RepID=A0AA36GIG4_CYLNA|nr:unnamed protein product [Cylicocyclus nassatus]